MILSRLPVGPVFRHLLPFPVDPGRSGMPRIAIEAVVRAPFGAVRIITTHLEYYGTLKRTAQVDALRSIYAEGSGHARLGEIIETDGGPYHDYPRPAATIITGDFNLEPDDPLHARMIERLRRRHAAAVRCMGGSASRHRASGDVQDLRKKEPRRTGAALRFHLRVRRPGAAPQVDSCRPGNPGLRSSTGACRVRLEARFEHGYHVHRRAQQRSRSRCRPGNARTRRAAASGRVGETVAAVRLACLGWRHPPAHERAGRRWSGESAMCCCSSPLAATRYELSWPKAGEGFAAYFSLPADMQTLVALLSGLDLARIHFHHVHGLPRAILDLPAALGVPYDCTLHDYYAICPQYHLVTEDGRYCGEPDAAGCAACLAKRPAQWGWTSLHGAPRSVRCCAAPSGCSRRRTMSQRASRATFPDCRSTVLPHPEAALATPRPRDSRRHARQSVAGEGIARRRRLRRRRASARPAAVVSRSGLDRRAGDRNARAPLSMHGRVRRCRSGRR